MLHLKQKVCGFYKLEAVKKSKSGKETKRLLADWFPNLITNAGLDYIGSDRSYFYDTTHFAGFIKYCMVGSGNTAPLVTDSILSNNIASTTTMTSGVASVETTTPYYRKLVLTYRFGEGVAAGNIAEVGIGWSTTECFSRALILDGSSLPTTITVLSDEYLDVTYEYRIYPKETDDTDSITFTGDIGGTYTWTSRLARAATWGIDPSGYKQLSMQETGWGIYAWPSTDAIQAITTYPSDSGDSITVDDVDTYTTGNYYTVTPISLELTQGNLTGGVSSIVLIVGPCYYQIGFSPAIPKTATDILTFNFKVSWGRV